MTFGTPNNGGSIWDNFMAINNPQMQNALFPPQFSAATSGSGSAQPELDQARQMLTPSQNALQATFGQNPVFGNSQFGKTTAGRVIGNLALAGQQAGPSATPADAVRIVSNMVRAPQEYNQAQQTGAAKAQGSAAVAQGALADTLAQINERNQQGGYFSSRSAMDYAKAGYDQWRELNPVDKPEAIMYDDNGRAWQPSVRNGVPSLHNVITGEVADPNNPPSFTKNPKGNKTAGDGGPNETLGKIIGMLGSDDPQIKAAGLIAKRNYLDLTAASAGGSASARTAAENPTKISDQDAQDLLETVRTSQIKQLQHAQSQKDWESDMSNRVRNFDTNGKAYAEYAQGIADSNKRLTDDLADYTASGAYRKGQTLADYLTAKAHAKTAPPPPPTKSKDSGKAWTPPQ